MRGNDPLTGVGPLLQSHLHRAAHVAGTQAETMRAIRAEREPQRLLPRAGMDPRRDRGPSEFLIRSETVEAVR